MSKVLDDNQKELDSAYLVDTISGISGFVLESWGPKDRNPEYAQALELVLSRLKRQNVPYIKVYIVSRNLTNALPNIQERAILIDGSSEISLKNKSPSEIRLAIGRKVGELKEKPTKSSKGGNRFKKILVHSPLISNQHWDKIASGLFNGTLFEPTTDAKELDSIVCQLQKSSLERPAGSEKPEQSNISTVAYYRDPLVKAWVLQNARGMCEVCSFPAPFENSEGLPYLEVHHVLPLSDGGSDTTTNTIALCPNCHRQLHFSKDKNELTHQVVQRIERLVQEGNS